MLTAEPHACVASCPCILVTSGTHLSYDAAELTSHPDWELSGFAAFERLIYNFLVGSTSKEQGEGDIAMSLRPGMRPRSLLIELSHGVVLSASSYWLKHLLFAK